MFTLVFIVHRPYFQHPQTKDYWTQDMAYEWKTFTHPFPLNHDPTIISTLKAYLLELNNVQPVSINIHHTSIGPSHTLEIIPELIVYIVHFDCDTQFTTLDNVKTFYL